MTGPRNADEIAQVWWLAWAHFALVHGHSLFFTDWQNYPVGLNFGMNGSMLFLGFVASPITATFGPVVTWNVLLGVAPVLSAFSMCLVLRRWTRWWPAAFAGGLLYGFSAYVIFNAGGYLFLAFVPLPPVILLLLYEILVRKQWNPIRTGVILGLVCGVQDLIFPEILASTVLMGALGAGLYVVVNRRTFSLKDSYLRAAGVSTLVTGFLALVFPLGFTFFGPQHAKGPPNSPNALAALHGDLLGPFVPGYLQRFTTPQLNSQWSQHLTTSPMMYMGVPLFITVVLLAILMRRRGIVVFCGAMAAVSFVLSLGSPLYVNGHDTQVPLPFVVLANLPITEGFLSTRFSLFTMLFGAAIVAIGIDVAHQRLLESQLLASASRRWREMAVALVALSIVIVALPLLPAHTQPTTPTGESAFFASKAADGIPTGSVVLAYPYPTAPFLPSGPHFSFVYTYGPINNVLVDQAVSGMRFKLVGGYGWRQTKGRYGTPKPSRLSPPSVETLFTASFAGVASPPESRLLKTADLPTDLRKFLLRYHVSTVVVLPLGHYPYDVEGVVTSVLGAPVHVSKAAVWFQVQHRLRSRSLR